MHTYLPHASFFKSAQVLDWRDLAMQRVQNLQIMQSLLGCKLDTTMPEPTGNVRKEFFDQDGNYVHQSELTDYLIYHVLTYEEVRDVELPRDRWRLVRLGSDKISKEPVVDMWRGYEWALLQYQKALVSEWNYREYTDTCWSKTRELFSLGAAWRQLPDRLPPWLGDPQLHRSHQSLLIRKNPKHYRPLFGDVPDDLPVIYPEFKE